MKLRYLHNVSTLHVEPERCTGCGMCMQVCPHEVLVLENKKAVISDLDACMECGACSRNCPFDAISVRAGVGCSYAVIQGTLKGTEPDCSCGCDKTCC